uniref:Uncharacterized protein n=1 Tax=Panagrellus redivivus TaxID=6233 RepID=A0A7E4VU67_PANRE
MRSIHLSKWSNGQRHVPFDLNKQLINIYGQVASTQSQRYSESIYEHSGNTNAIILKGNVMITKNPMYSVIWDPELICLRVLL